MLPTVTVSVGNEFQGHTTPGAEEDLSEVQSRAFTIDIKIRLGSCSHPHKVADPVQLQLFQLSVNAEGACSFQHFYVRKPVLPSQLEYVSETAEVEVVKIPQLFLLDIPDLCFMQQRWQDESFVHLEFGAKVETVSIPDHVLRASKDLAGFGDLMGDLIVNFGGAEMLLPRLVKVSTDFS
ncbi:unnamed protein product [Schistocephalus solidus]|uniref:Uncharacterized protein n=1 Tax=Schistocephalus solidus TaxID=70667 RepID=A0A183SLB4_SCHSO|nr:unnamed protein product [Schistocephalus solidus]